ncbi:hypothetical protein DFH06DRAFT_1151378 [Mycena polygramma]|nr:hypothetical protein DFH06DRAFT_1151378 [Mycena polygramma]
MSYTPEERREAQALSSANYNDRWVRFTHPAPAPSNTASAIAKSAIQRHAGEWPPSANARKPWRRTSSPPAKRLVELLPRSTDKKMRMYWRNAHEMRGLAPNRSASMSPIFNFSQNLTIIPPSSTPRRERLRSERFALRNARREARQAAAGLDEDVDLQRGERYTNMDYLLWHALAATRTSASVNAETIEQNWFHINVMTPATMMPPGQRHTELFPSSFERMLQEQHAITALHCKGIRQPLSATVRQHRFLRAIRLHPGALTLAAGTEVSRGIWVASLRSKGSLRTGPSTTTHLIFATATILGMDATRSSSNFSDDSKDSTPDFSGKKFYTPARAEDGYQACDILFVPGTRFKDHQRTSSDGRSHYNLVFGGPDSKVALYTPGDAYTVATRLNDRGVKPMSIQRCTAAEIDELVIPICRREHLGCRTRNKVVTPRSVSTPIRSVSELASGSAVSEVPRTPAWSDGTWYCYGAGFITRDEAAKGARTFVRETYGGIVKCCRQMHELSPGDSMFFVLEDGMITNVSTDALNGYLRQEQRQTSIFTTPKTTRRR